MTIPLLPIPHNWNARVEHTRRWSTAVLTARSGRDQAIGQSVRARETLRYQFTTVTPEQWHALVSPAIAAATANTAATRGQVRVPRWEDVMVLAAPAGSGDTVLTLAADGDDATLRRWQDGDEIALCVPGQRTVVTRTLTASSAVTSSTLTLASALGAAWPAGTRVAPVSVCRLAEAMDADRATGTIASTALTLTLDDPLAGTAAGIGAGVVPVVASMTLRSRLNEDPTVYFGFQFELQAQCFDAAGVRVPPPGPLTWTSSHPSTLPVRVVDPLSGVASVESTGITGASGFRTFTVTEPISGVSAQVVLNPGPGA